MTLDEAIKHFEEVAEKNEQLYKHPIHCGEDFMKYYLKRAAGYRQLAEWLTELKELRRLVDIVAKYAGKSEDICERYLPSIDGDLCVTDGMGASNCTCCGYEYRCDYKKLIGGSENGRT